MHTRIFQIQIQVFIQRSRFCHRMSSLVFTMSVMLMLSIKKKLSCFGACCDHELFCLSWSLVLCLSVVPKCLCNYVRFKFPKRLEPKLKQIVILAECSIHAIRVPTCVYNFEFLQFDHLPCTQSWIHHRFYDKNWIWIQLWNLGNTIRPSVE